MPHEWLGLDKEKKKKRKKRPKDERTIETRVMSREQELNLYKIIGYEPKPVPSSATDITVHTTKRPKETPKLEQEPERPKVIPYHNNNNSRHKIIDSLTDSAIS